MAESHTEDQLRYAQDAIVTLSAAQLAAPIAQRRAGLRHSPGRWAATGQARVAFMGGSITRMTGWSDLTQGWLRARFPAVAFTFVNAAVGGTNSTYGVFRSQADLWAQGPFDLLIIEFAVNDGSPVSRDNQRLQAMEGLLRQGRAQNPALDILCLYLADEAKVQAYRQQQEPAVITHHERVTAHYGIPVLNLALAVTRSLDAGTFTWADFSGDSCHPKPFGHQQYLACIADFLAREWAAPPISQPPYDQPAPWSADHLQGAHLLPAHTAQLGPGWSHVRGWLAERTCNYDGPVDVLTATTPGAALELAFTGRTLGLDVITGMDAGMLMVSLDDGPATELQLFDHFSAKFHRPLFRLIAPGLPPGPHRATLRVGDQRHGDSLGHAVRIRQFGVA